MNLQEAPRVASCRSEFSIAITIDPNGVGGSLHERLVFARGGLIRSWTFPKRCANARASGHGGMVGGQAIDLESVGKSLALPQLETMHRHKTGALIETSVRIGALTARSVNEQALASLTQYAKALGLAFQVQDDLLDIEGDTTVIGKPQGSDVARAKPTYPALLGVAGAREHLAALLENAQDSLRAFGSEADPLRAMADYVVARTH